MSTELTELSLTAELTRMLPPSSEDKDLVTPSRCAVNTTSPDEALLVPSL